jgi:hypothetical protein
MRALKTTRYVILIIITLIAVNLSYAKSWHYAEWMSDITIHDDSTFTVREIQTVEDFESASFLKRNIELEGLDKITDIRIYDEKEVMLKDSEIAIQYNADKVRIKIIPQVKEKKKTWIIEYTVQGGIIFRKNYNELRWNVFPSDKQAYVEKAEVLVNLSQEVYQGKLTPLLFVTRQGSENESPNCSVINGSTLKYWGENISSRDNLVVVARWPKGMLKEDSWRKIRPYLWFLIPIFVSVVMLWKWWIGTKSPEARRHIISHSNLPEDISPAGLFALVNGKLGVKEVTATLVDLANRGYLRVIEQDKKNVLTPYRHSLQKLLDYDDYIDLREHERFILRHIFSGQDVVPLEQLKEKLRRNISRINKAVWNELVKNRYIHRSPRDIKRRYTISGALYLIVSLFAFTISKNAFLAIGLTGIVVIVLGRRISPETQKGMEAKWYALGFKKYLTQETNSGLINDMEPDLFSVYLPYAIVFGMEKEWANIFAKDYKLLPKWYHSSENKATTSAIEFIGVLTSVIAGDSSSGK